MKAVKPTDFFCIFLSVSDCCKDCCRIFSLLSISFVNEDRALAFDKFQSRVIFLAHLIYYQKVGGNIIVFTCGKAGRSTTGKVIKCVPAYVRLRFASEE